MRCVAALGAVLLFLAHDAAAQEPAKEPAREPSRATRAAEAQGDDLKLTPNVIVSITIGKEEGAAPERRTYRLVARDRERSEMLMGWRTPIPTTSQPGDDAEAVTSYVYQNVGVTAKLTVRLLADRRVFVDGELEVSGTRDEEGPRPPTIGTFQQTLKVLLREGAALRVAEVPDPDGGTLYVELEVEVLD